MLIKRRDFLKLLGGVSGAIAVSSCGLDQIIDVPEEVIKKVKKRNIRCGEPRRIESFCALKKT